MNNFFFFFLFLCSLCFSQIKTQQDLQSAKPPLVFFSDDTILAVPFSSNNINFLTKHQISSWYNFKSNKIDFENYISNNIFLSYLDLVRENGLTLQYISRQNKRICEEAVNENGLALQFVKRQTEKICKIAIMNNYNALRFVNGKFKTLGMCRYAVRICGYAIRYVSRKKEDICMIAVKSEGCALGYINNQTEHLCTCLNRRV